MLSYHLRSLIACLLNINECVYYLIREYGQEWTICNFAL
jgi:hypothetical protein